MSVLSVVSEAVDIAVSLGLNLLAWPVQTLVLAGLISGIGRYIARDEVSIASLYTSFGGALRALLYGVFSSVVTLFVYFLFLAPGLAACFGAVMTMESDESTAILLTLLGAVLVLAGIVAFVPISLTKRPRGVEPDKPISLTKQPRIQQDL